MVMQILSLGLLGCTKINANDKDALLALLEDTAQSQSNDTEDTTQSEDFENSHYVLLKNILPNDHIEFDSEGSAVGYVLDWRTDWSISFIIPELEETDIIQDSFMGFCNGANWMGLKNSSEVLSVYWSDAGCYPDQENAGGMSSTISDQFGELQNGDRITFSYTFGNDSGSMQIWRNDVPLDAKLGIGSIGTEGEMSGLSFGQQIAGTQTEAWAGGIDSLVILPTALDLESIQELLDTEDYRDLSWLNVSGGSWWPMGEDQFPNIIDWIQNDNAIIKDSSEEQFVAYP